MVPSARDGEPLGVLGSPRVIGRALQREVQRHLEAELCGGGHEGVEVVDRAERGVHGVVAALVAADRPRRADVVGARRSPRCCGPLRCTLPIGWIGGR